MTRFAKKVFILTGKVGSGKSTRLEELADELKMRGTDVAGFLCRGNDQQGKRTGYTLVNVRDGSETLFATRESRKGWQGYGRFFFNPEAFVRGEKIIREAIENRSEVIVIDEVGPLELEDSGWAPMLKDLLKQNEMVQLWAVREKILERVIKKWNIPENSLIRIGREEKEEIIKKIIAHV